MDGSISVPGDVRQLISDLIIEYAHAIDDDRLESWADFFTDECSYRIINRENYDKGQTVPDVALDINTWRGTPK